MPFTPDDLVYEMQVTSGVPLVALVSIATRTRISHAEGAALEFLPDCLTLVSTDGGTWATWRSSSNPIATMSALRTAGVEALEDIARLSTIREARQAETRSEERTEKMAAHARKIFETLEAQGAFKLPTPASRSGEVIARIAAARAGAGLAGTPADQETDAADQAPAPEEADDPRMLAYALDTRMEGQTQMVYARLALVDDDTPADAPGTPLGPDDLHRVPDGWHPAPGMTSTFRTQMSRDDAEAGLRRAGGFSYPGLVLWYAPEATRFGLVDTDDGLRLQLRAAQTGRALRMEDLRDVPGPISAEIAPGLFSLDEKKPRTSLAAALIGAGYRYDPSLDRA